MKLTIDRKTWLRGEGSYDSFLRRTADGKQCCLGFLAQACGYSKEEITGQSSPFKLFQSVRPVEHPAMDELVEHTDSTRGVRYANKWATNELMVLNDDININTDLAKGERNRELQITKKFSEIGVEVEFVG